MFELEFNWGVFQSLSVLIEGGMGALGRSSGPGSARHGLGATWDYCGGLATTPSPRRAAQPPWVAAHVCVCVCVAVHRF